MPWKWDLFPYGSLWIFPYQLLCLSSAQARRVISCLILYADCKPNYISDLRRFDACGNSANSAHLNKLTQSSQRYTFFSLKGKYFDFEVIQTTATAESHFRNTWLDQAHLVGMCDKAKVPPHQEHLSTVFKCNIPVSQLSGDGRVLNVICVPFKGTVWKGTYWKSCWKQKW